MFVEILLEWQLLLADTKYQKGEDLHVVLVKHKERYGHQATNLWVQLSICVWPVFTHFVNCSLEQPYIPHISVFECLYNPLLIRQFWLGSPHKLFYKMGEMLLMSKKAFFSPVGVHSSHNTFSFLFSVPSGISKLLTWLFVGVASILQPQPSHDNTITVVLNLKHCCSRVLMAVIARCLKWTSWVK